MVSSSSFPNQEPETRNQELRTIRRAGSIGHYGCFSFFPSKNLGAFGDGGMVVTNDTERAEKLRVLRAHGSKPKYYHKFVGGNFRLDTLQAAIVLAKLKHLDDWTAKRQANAKRYDALFEESGLVSSGQVQLPKVYPQITPITGEEERGVHPQITQMPEDSIEVRKAGTNLRESAESVDRSPGSGTRPSVESVKSADVPSGFRHILNQYVIRVPRRNDLQAFLKEKGIGTEVYYPLPLHLQECFAYLGQRTGDLPESEKAANETLAIPVYPELSDEQAKYVVDSVRTFYAGQP